MPLGAASGNYVVGVELLNEEWSSQGYHLRPNSEYHDDYPGSELVGDNVHKREANKPDHQLRSLISAKCLRMSSFPDSGDVGLEAAII